MQITKYVTFTPVIAFSLQIRLSPLVSKITEFVRKTEQIYCINQKKIKSSVPIGDINTFVQKVVRVYIKTKIDMQMVYRVVEQILKRYHGANPVVTGERLECTVTPSNITVRVDNLASEEEKLQHIKLCVARFFLLQRYGQLIEVLVERVAAICDIESYDLSDITMRQRVLMDEFRLAKTAYHIVSTNLTKLQNAGK